MLLGLRGVEAALVIEQRLFFEIPDADHLRRLFGECHARQEIGRALLDWPRFVAVDSLFEINHATQYRSEMSALVQLLRIKMLLLSSADQRGRIAVMLQILGFLS